MKKILLLTLFSAILCASAAYAQVSKPMSSGASKDMIAIYGHGNSKCSEYLDYQGKGQEAISKNYQVWVNGFLSAYNTLMASNGNVARGKRAEELMLWMTNYCRNNPTSYFQRATIEMLRALESGEF